MSFSSSQNKKNVSDINCRETRNTHFMFNNIYIFNRAVYEITWKNIVERGQTDDSMAHVHCMLETQGYKYTLRLCNSYCCSTETMVA